jgi:hypothetical protein
MQWYAQDAKPAESLLPGVAGAPFNYSIDPGAGHTFYGGNLPAIENAFHYHQIGNLGIAAFSGAYSIEETQPLMEEACAWLGQQHASANMTVAMLTAHWDTAGLGCDQDLALPELYDLMKVIPGCDGFDKRGMLKFVMGHTHCNVPHPHGKVDTGFMVAGMGMGGCGNYGIPLFDTTAERVRVWHFEVVSKNGTDHYDRIMSCLTAPENAEGWRGCTHYADLWLDQPIVPL